MPAGWIVAIVALWLLVLFETVLLLLLLRALGELRRQGAFAATPYRAAGPGGLEIGDTAPPFAAIDASGSTVRLDDTRGKRRLLAFVSPTCSACADTIEALNAGMSEYPDLSMLVIGGPDSQANQSYAIEHGARMTILTAASSLGRDSYRIPGVPFVYVLNAASVIVAKGIVNGKEDLGRLLIPSTASAVASS